MDHATFGALYETHVRRVYDYLYYRTHHRETAEDLTSLVFTKALASLPRFDASKGAFGAWVTRIARNTLIDHYRAVKPMSDIEDVWDSLASGIDVARDADARERLAAVEKRIMAMPAETREIVLLRVWDGLSHAEIAEIVGKSEPAVKMAFSRAMSGLRKNAPLVALLLMLAKP